MACSSFVLYRTNTIFMYKINKNKNDHQSGGHFFNLYIQSSAPIYPQPLHGKHNNSQRIKHTASTA